MNVRKIKKFKKLKYQIWPSVLFLVISIIVAFSLAIPVFVSIISLYFAQDRLKLSYENTLYISRMFLEATTEDEERKIIDYLKSNPDLAEAVYIVDEKNNVLFGFGEKTFDLQQKEKLTSNKDISLYIDKNAKYNLYIKPKNNDNERNNIETEENLSIDINAIDFKNITLMFDTLNIFQKKVLFDDPFWLGISISNNRNVLVKCKVEFYDSDILLGILVALLFMVIMSIPILFLFINLIRNIHSQRNIIKLIYTDPLTDGNSWLYFEHTADKIVSARRNANKLFAIIDLSIIKYASLCTFHGVKVGEELLVKVDKLLANFTGKYECNAHYGKSSFALLLCCESKENCEKRMNEFSEELTKTFENYGVLFHSGIYYIEIEKDENGKFIRRKNFDVDESYNCASNARAAITDVNHSSVITFDQKLRDDQIWEHKVEEKMQAALDNEEFKIYIQPKYNPSTEELSGAEALVRWINDEDGFISPGKFIPLFEKNGFITKLDDYMLSHVAKLQSDWLSQGKKVVPISVNVSRAHFADPNLAEHISSIVDGYNLSHHLIEIELTESAFFDDKNALLNTVHKLQEMGFDISMDDFGAGYSSLNSLKDLPLNVLKLDAEFFRGETDEGRGEIVISQAIQLAKELNMKIVAEGIEKKEQVDFLAAHNCDMIQGFYYAKPMPANEYETRLKKEENTNG